jgi:hypothetical protein
MARKTENHVADEDLLVTSRADHGEEITHQVQRAEEQLILLKRQQEEIERQKRELEELNRQQHEFREGRREVLEKLTRGLVVLERQLIELKRDTTQVEQTSLAFEEQLKEIQHIDPEHWEAEQLAEELARALAKIDQAQSIYAQSRARLEALRETSPNEEELHFGSASESGSGYSFGFFDKMQAGFAYSLPAIVVSFIWLLIFLSKH